MDSNTFKCKCCDSKGSIREDVNPQTRVTTALIVLRFWEKRFNEIALRLKKTQQISELRLYFSVFLKEKNQDYILEWIDNSLQSNQVKNINYQSVVVELEGEDEDEQTGSPKKHHLSKRITQIIGFSVQQSFFRWNNHYRPYLDWQ